MNTQPLLDLEFFPQVTHEDRLRKVVKVVVSQFDGDMTAYWESIKPKVDTQDEQDRNRLKRIADGVKRQYFV